jgi:hypothetical protein
MATTQQYFNLVQTGKSSWVAVHVEPSIETITASASAPDALFGQVAVARVPLPERFPRLTIAVIALVLLAATLSTEIDLLRGAGFRWQ